MGSSCYLLAVLALSLGFRLEEGACQHYFLLRPVPSDTLPVVALKEDPDPRLDPRDKDLNETELRSSLGRHFDPQFMSVSPPEERSAGRQSAGRQVPDLRLQLRTDLRSLELQAQRGRRPRPSRKQRRRRRRLQLWLWAHAFCPVVHAWTDLGRRFWPRYVNAGRCYRKRSCSVPEGMVCRPARSTRLTILRWRCARQKKGGQECAWTPVQYPVISECKCACQS
ncbi:uncharacterized protein V6R79_004383 [Siganus canaliculatus]